MKKIIFIFLINIFFTINALSSTKEELINNLTKTNNLNFDFEQNINGKIETGNCTLEYPKKIFCNYNLKNKKIMVSDGNSLVIKTKSGSYQRQKIG